MDLKKKIIIFSIVLTVFLYFLFDQNSRINEKEKSVKYEAEKHEQVQKELSNLKREHNSLKEHFERKEKEFEEKEKKFENKITSTEFKSTGDLESTLSKIFKEKTPCGEICSYDFKESTPGKIWPKIKRNYDCNVIMFQMLKYETAKSWPPPREIPEVKKSFFFFLKFS